MEFPFLVREEMLSRIGWTHGFREGTGLSIYTLPNLQKGCFVR